MAAPKDASIIADVRIDANSLKEFRQHIADAIQGAAKNSSQAIDKGVTDTIQAKIQELTTLLKTLRGLGISTSVLSSAVDLPGGSSGVLRVRQQDPARELRAQRARDKSARDYTRTLEAANAVLDDPNSRSSPFYKRAVARRDELARFIHGDDEGKTYRAARDLQANLDSMKEGAEHDAREQLKLLRGPLGPSADEHYARENLKLLRGPLGPSRVDFEEGQRLLRKEQLAIQRYNSPSGERTAGQGQRMLDDAKKLAVSVTPTIVGVVNQMKKFAHAGDFDSARLLSLKHGEEFDALADAIHDKEKKNAEKASADKLTRAGLVYGANRFITGLGTAASGMLTQDPLMSNMGGQQVLGLTSSAAHGVAGMAAARYAATGSAGAGAVAIGAAVAGAVVDGISNIAQKGSAIRGDANSRMAAGLANLGVLIGGQYGGPDAGALAAGNVRDTARLATALRGMQTDKRVWGLYQAMGGDAATLLADARRTDGESAEGGTADEQRQLKEEARLMRFVSAAADRGRSGEQILSDLGTGMGGMTGGAGGEDLLYALAYRAKDYGYSGKGFGALLGASVRAGGGALAPGIAGILGRAGDAMNLGVGGKDEFASSMAKSMDRFTAMGASPLMGLALSNTASALAGAGASLPQVQGLLEAHANTVQGGRGLFGGIADAMDQAVLLQRAASLGGGDPLKMNDIMTNTTPSQLLAAKKGVLGNYLTELTLSGRGLNAAQRQAYMAGDTSALPAQEEPLGWWSKMRGAPAAQRAAAQLGMRSSQAELEELGDIAQQCDSLAESLSRAVDKLKVLSVILPGGSGSSMGN